MRFFIQGLSQHQKVFHSNFRPCNTGFLEEPPQKVGPSVRWTEGILVDVDLRLPFRIVAEIDETVFIGGVLRPIKRIWIVFVPIVIGYVAVLKKV